MNFTEYAKERLLNNELDVRHIVKADIKIKFRHTRKSKLTSWYRVRLNRS